MRVLFFHFSATYCHGETLQPRAGGRGGVSVIGEDVSACAVNRALTVNYGDPL